MSQEFPKGFVKAKLENLEVGLPIESLVCILGNLGEMLDAEWTNEQGSKHRRRTCDGYFANS